MTDTLTPISRLLTADRMPDSRIAVDGALPVTWATFVDHVGALCEGLHPRGPGRWVVFTDNTYAFAVALMAVWQSGSVAVLAPNGQMGTLAELSREALGVISDRSSPGVTHSAVVSGRDGRGWFGRPLDRSAVSLELLTSGSTGAAKPVPKTLANLEDEIVELERRWGDRLRGLEIFATVSHQHIYGLLFRVLWPLSTGRTLRAQTSVYPQVMAADMANAGACALIASPAHLSRLQGFSGLAAMARHCRIIFSSGGALDARTALALRDALGAAPFEVFGSTETGGVAWRQQDGSDEARAWTLFESVQVDRHAEQGVLRIRSPFVHAATGEFTMADRVRFLADGRFILEGRNDRTVKVGDKRLSLPEMEALLESHAYVAQAALVVLDVERGDRVAAAIVPTPAGREALARQGRRGTCQALLQTLQPYWDQTLLPKAWRYVNHLPRDAQGKVTVSALHATFANPFDPAVDAPEVLAESMGEGHRQQTLRVPETLAYLDGHFVGLPVVPGVAQLRWVMNAARPLIGQGAAIQRIEALKFKDVLRPGDVFHLSAEVSRDGTTRLAFRLWNDRSVFSSGRCVLVTAPDAVS